MLCTKVLYSKYIYIFLLLLLKKYIKSICYKKKEFFFFLHEIRFILLNWFVTYVTCEIYMKYVRELFFILTKRGKCQNSNADRYQNFVQPSTNTPSSKSQPCDQNCTVICFVSFKFRSVWSFLVFGFPKRLLCSLPHQRQLGFSGGLLQAPPEQAR